MTGRCLCGAVRYEVEGRLPPIVNCHCQHCRRAHGAAFVSIVWLRRSAFRLTAGEDRVARYAVGEGYRAFCRTCGTRIYNGGSSETRFITLVVSTLDDDAHEGPVLHLNVESKASWHAITDDLPQFERFSPDVTAHLQAVRSAETRSP